MTDERIERVTMPKWGLSMQTGKLTEWLVAEGDVITSGDDLAEIDTDKIAGTLESSWAGVLRKFVAEVGDDVPVGGTIAVIAPPEVPDAEIDTLVEQAREEIASGAIEDAGGPVAGSVEVGGRNIRYTSLGSVSPAEADPVVLVHGYGGDGDSWLFVQEPLSAERTAYTIDLPGHGASTKEVGDGSLRMLADTVLGFLDALELERAHLVGHSLGGAIVTAVAAAAPERVASLSLIAPAGFGDQINADYLRGFASAGSRRELKPHLTALFADPAQATRKLADDLMKFKRLDGVDKALSTLLGTLLAGDAPGIDAATLLEQVTAPLAVVWGRADQVLPVANAEALAGRVEVRVLEAAGHMAHMEQPAEVVAEVRRAIGGG
ncbi:pyruvate dehydrogenase E2 component (dihydrolipoamide acetyltransferase) [Tamaricihabitans halophyticus]|uniref:Pyruvate dehydrogenase E2 component (Dihydrolipoamide acetyltransferase) n=1 Tax=Tamaricihabitans halophyticus TaxID=1262583 RepID=A0A4R2QYD6_9PSEU|nr:acetoin dehydrogenase dihydrolipoyllysine-residue acetyltransferase subunit [Tamaricihabitans halophyticus]TCP54038.1 pyruvate dehydrogenase E2 component (dihydrolipoamide acetyltransferase) [Tamaricihabitans halophyticus]